MLHGYSLGLCEALYKSKQHHKMTLTADNEDGVLGILVVITDLRKSIKKGRTVRKNSIKVSWHLK